MGLLTQGLAKCQTPEGLVFLCMFVEVRHPYRAESPVTAV
jgi:hypothetical protein